MYQLRYITCVNLFCLFVCLCFVSETGMFLWTHPIPSKWWSILKSAVHIPLKFFASSILLLGSGSFGNLLSDHFDSKQSKVSFDLLVTCHPSLSFTTIAFMSCEVKRLLLWHRLVGTVSTVFEEYCRYSGPLVPMRCFATTSSVQFPCLMKTYQSRHNFVRSIQAPISPPISPQAHANNKSSIRPCGSGARIQWTLAVS